MNDGALNVVEVGIVLERALQEAGFLAELRDVSAIVVREELVGEDSVGHLRNA